jgi:hypothetical protein|tara:strand:- start:818 stop:1009 length:192 start_codon:yes stop_codon:yes gene_type:complete
MKLSIEEERHFMKCIEEMQELSLELIHAINKPNKENSRKICKEIRDVEKYLNFLKKQFGSKNE